MNLSHAVIDGGEAPVWVKRFTFAMSGLCPLSTR